MRNLSIIVFILALLNTLESLSIDLYLPAFPGMAKIFQTDIGHIQISISIFFAGFAIGQLLWGPLSDKKGRKPMLYCGLLLFITGAVAIIFTTNIYMLWIMRFIQAFGGSAGIVIGRAIVVDLYDREKAVTIFSRQSQISGIAPIVAPLLGSVFLRFWGWNSAFTFLSILGALTLLLVVKFVPETNSGINSPDALHNESRLKHQLKTIIANKDFISNTIIGSVAFASLIIYISNAPFLFMELHGFSSEMFSFTFAFNSMALILAAYITPKLLLRTKDTNILLSAAILLFSMSCLHIFVAVNNMPVGLEIAVLYLSLIAIGLLFPITTAHALSPFKEGRGTAAALMGFMQLIITFMTSAVVGLLESQSIMPMILSRVLLSFVGIYFAYYTFSQKRIAA